MKKKLLKLCIFMLLLISFSCFSVQAAYNVQLNVSSKPTVKTDLNGDGKKDTITIKKGSGKKLYIYINKKKVGTISGFRTVGGTTIQNDSVWIIDMNSKDKYKEIIVTLCNSETYVCRYNGTKLIQYAYGSYSEQKTDILTAGNFNAWMLSSSGDGSLIGKQIIWSEGTGAEMYFNVKYKVVNGKLVVNQSKIHESYSTRSLTAANKLVAYKNTNMTGSNQQVFVVNKGGKYKPLKLKIGKTYSFLQVQDVKTGKTGWVFIRTSGIKISAYA